MKPGDIVVDRGCNPGIWQLVRRSGYATNPTTGEIWFVKFPFSEASLYMIACYEKDLHVPTLEELGYLRLMIDNLMREIVVKAERYVSPDESQVSESETSPSQTDR